MKAIERASLWKNVEDGPIEYVCFRELETGRYWCSGANGFEDPDSSA